LHPNAADYFNESCSNITRSNATPIYTDTRNIPISDEANEFAFYPNPAYQELSFVFKSKPQSGQDVFIFDALGRLCREGRVQDGDKMSIDKLTTGVYWVKTGAGVQKMVKL
jgi:hypothetical protein